MSVRVGSFTPSVGTTTIDNLTFLPTNLLLWVGNSAAATSSSVAKGEGRCTSSNQSYDCFYIDAVNNRQNQENGTNMCIRVKKWDAGTSTFVDATAATWVDFHTNTPTNFGFTLNFTASDARQIRYRASDV